MALQRSEEEAQAACPLRIGYINNDTLSYLVHHRLWTGRPRDAYAELVEIRLLECIEHASCAALLLLLHFH